jgi:hypothetical protein
MKPYAFLKSSEPPRLAGHSERAIRDHERAGVTIGGAELRRALVTRDTLPKEAHPKLSSRRTKIWELTAMLHCSIIGTCLTTGELKALLRKADAAIDENATIMTFTRLPCLRLAKTAMLRNEFRKRLTIVTASR